VTMDIQTVMAATVHDVKNSLGLIDGQLNGLVKKLFESDPESAVEIRRIQLECNRINNGMVHMLGLYKMNQGHFSAIIDEVLVSDVINDAISRYSEVLKTIGVDLFINYNDENCMWFLDSNLIEGLLANVLTNSIRYTKSKLVFDVEEINGWLNIKITDDGLGFPNQLLTLLDNVESFSFQTNATGLGVYFCSKIAATHQNNGREGYIKLSNLDEKGGAVFDLWLP